MMVSFALPEHSMCTYTCGSSNLPEERLIRFCTMQWPEITRTWADIRYLLSRIIEGVEQGVCAGERRKGIWRMKVWRERHTEVMCAT